MFIGSEAETEGTGGPDLPMKIIAICFLEEKLVRTSLEKQFDTPPPPPLELSGSAHACLDRNFIFYFLHVAGLAIILSRDNW